MDNRALMLIDALDLYVKSKSEIDSVLGFYETEIKNNLDMIGKSGIEKDRKIIENLFKIQNEVSIVIYKYNYPVNELINNFVYEFDRQDNESIDFILNQINTNSGFL